MDISSPTTDYSLPALVSRASLEQIIINRCVADGQFRQHLIDDPVTALGELLGTPLPPGLDVRVYVEDANTYYYVSPNTDEENDAFSTEVGAAPVVMAPRASFTARLNYLLSATQGDPAQLESLTQAMRDANNQASQSSTTARNAEVTAAQAGEQVLAAETALEEAEAAALLLPDDSSVQQAVENAQAALQLAQQEYDQAAQSAAALRQDAISKDEAALDANSAYEDSLRAAFQQQFAQDAIAALNRFLNLQTPFGAYLQINDTDSEQHPAIPAGNGICLVHLVETTGAVIYLTLPYTPNNSLFQGPYTVQFDGVSSYIQVPASPSLQAQGWLVAEAWVCSNGFRAGYDDVILSTLANGGGWQLEMGGGTPKFTAVIDGVSQTVIANDLAQAAILERTTASLRLAGQVIALLPGKWHYLSGVFGEGKLSICVNGRKLGEIPVSGSLTPGGDLVIGRNAALAQDQSFFQGLMDGARLWGDALTPGVILSDLPTVQDPATLPTPLQEALLAHYAFDEGADFSALDDSPNHNDGWMVNAIWQIAGQTS